MTAAEPIQELGRKGVAIIKRWLEATTHIELPFDIYNHEISCVVKHLHSDSKKDVKRFDLAGHMLTGSKDRVIVECKRYSSPSGQYGEFQKFLCIAYGSLVREMEEFKVSRPPNRRFIWVTFHPFNLSRWRYLETHEEIRVALAAYPELLAGRTVDEDLLRQVANNVMVLVFNEKQKDLSLTANELQKVLGVVKRKADQV